MKKKTLSLLIAMALIIGCMVSGTLAWLSDSTEHVKNTFTTSDINITLQETTGTEYKMIPGYTIDKDPKVTVVSGSEECYLFVQLSKTDNFDSYMSYEIATGWTPVPNKQNYFYRVVNTADMGTPFSILLNDKLTVKGTVDKYMMEQAKTTVPGLAVKAYATQLHKNNTENFTVEEAWTNVMSDFGN